MLQFVREIPISIVLQSASSARRGFLFHMAVGFSKPVSPLSGMTVNLMVVDSWLGKLKADLESTVFQSKSDSLSHAFAEVMAVARLNLVEQCEVEDAKLISIDFREERGWGFSWQHLQSPQEMTVRHAHFLEAFLQSSADFGLLKVELAWARVADCEADFAHEGFKILKTLSARSLSELTLKLAPLKETRLSSGSYLQEIHVRHLSDQYTLTL
ncbi:hypothetical protein ACLVWU_12035 [Bdellovibrio sp. HCB290]|uniref:hypothetical protein n=1 Tax=Bdellovibrio sp. HCB290 TaxID=3394356 RepID=UPI0039B53A50